LPLTVSKSEIRQTALETIRWLSKGGIKADERTIDDGRKWIKAVGSVRAAVIESGNQELWNALEGSILVPNGGEFVYGVATDCDVAKVRFRDMNYRIARVGFSDFLVQQISQNRSYLHWVLDETVPILNKE